MKLQHLPVLLTLLCFSCKERPQPVYRNYNDAPAPAGPYVQVSSADGLLFISGQLGIEPRSGKLANGIESEARQSLQNIRAILERSHSGMDRVLKTTIYLTDLKDFARVNKIYAEYFTKVKPARTTVQVSALPLQGHIEIECIAAQNKK